MNITKAFQVLIYLILFFVLHKFVVALKTSQFSQSNMIVEFEPIRTLKTSPIIYRDETDYFPMLNTISNKFSKLITAPSTLNNSVEISRAIASFNRITNRSMEVLICLDMERLLIDIPSEIKRISNSISETNTIYPGTVSHLVLFVSHDMELEIVSNFVTQMKTKVNSSIKVGLNFHLSDCFTYGTQFRKELAPILTLIDLVIFRCFKDVESFLGHFKACKKEVEQNVDSKIKVGFSTAWEPPVQIYSSGMGLSLFWENMNDWASSLNTLVFISQAFDNGETIASGTGWWTLVKNSSDKPSKFVFEEKKTVQLRKLRKESPFDSKNFVVSFYEPGARDNSSGPYTQKQTMQRIELISTRFSKVFIPGIWYLFRGENIVSLIAKWNCENDYDLRLKVYLGYVKTSLDMSLKLAKNANLFCSGTVIYLIENVSVDSTELEIMQGRINTTKIKLGVSIKFQDCEESIDKVARIGVVNQLDLIILINQPIQPIRPTKEINICKENLQRINPAINVGLTTFSYINDSRKETGVDDLLKDWKNWNDISKESNITVFMLNSFDIRIASKVHNAFVGGWWSVVTRERTRYENLELIFKEKMEIGKIIEPRERIKLYSNDTPKIEAEDDTGKLSNDSLPSQLTIIYISVSVAIAIIVLGVITLLGFYIKIKNQNLILTNEEIREFYEGCEQNAIKITDDKEKFILALSSTAYNKDYELSKNYFNLNNESTLGSGAFGNVCKGNITKDGESMDVAVKMLKKSSPASALKGLLSEIKIMSYLGKHENIVSLMGAYTQELKKGGILVFTELCENGSLEDYLRGCKNVDGPCHENFDQVMEYEANSVMYGNMDPRLSLDSNYLYRWSCEIANGMKYLASKNVVHADLATRNVLLTIGMKAKISDFGLSRRLYDYANYVKTQQVPLPWRWLAPESMGKMVFNEKTDVWAYGITLWEIYSLGLVPYSGLSWTVDFHTKLLNGLRLEEPQFVDGGMYTLMLKCWNNDPNKRPSFSEIKDSLYR